MNPFRMGWMGRAIMGMFAIVPSWMGVDFFQKNFNIRGEIMMVWYFAGVVLGSSVLMRMMSMASTGDFLPSRGKLLILILGLTCGAIANLLIFGATALAASLGKNPALVVIITNMASVVVFFLSAALSYLAPAYVSQIKFNLFDLIGVLTIIVGMGIIIVNR